MGVQSSYLSYQAIVRDISKALERKAAEPMVARDVARFTQNAPAVHSVDDLFDDDRTYNFAVKAYGMDDLAYARALMRKVIGEGVGANSYAARLSDSRYLALAKAFQLGDGQGAISILAAGEEAVVQRYRDTYARIGESAVANINSDVIAYKAAVKGITNFEDLVNSDTALKFTMRAFGLDRFLGQLEDVRKVVNGGANKFEFKDEAERWQFDQFRANFGIQADAVGYQDNVIEQFRQAVPKLGETLKKNLEADVEAFSAGLPRIKTVDDLLKNQDVLLLGIRAFGLENLLSDKKAFASALKGNTNALKFENTDEKVRFESFKAIFAFDDKGNAASASLLKDIDKTVQNYIRNILEVDIGQEDNNVRLALNFQRRAADIKSAYDILADDALAAVVRKAFGIPPESAAADIDAQARLILSKIDIKDFEDPAKVEKLINRFLLISDAEAGAAGSPILSLFDGGADQGDMIYDILQAQAKVRR